MDEGLLIITFDHFSRCSCTMAFRTQLNPPEDLELTYCHLFLLLVVFKLLGDILRVLPSESHEPVEALTCNLLNRVS